MSVLDFSRVEVDTMSMMMGKPVKPDEQIHKVGIVHSDQIFPLIEEGSLKVCY